MVSLMELLPLMVDEYGQPAGWKNMQDSITKTLAPGNAEHIGPLDFPGWIRHLVLVPDNRYTKLIHTVWEKQLTYTPYSLYTDGNTTPGPAGIPWVENYVTAEDMYKILWQPTPPQEILAQSDIWVEAPDENPVTGDAITTNTDITLTYHLILIYDRKHFLESMHEVLGAITEIYPELPELPEFPEWPPPKWWREPPPWWGKEPPASWLEKMIERVLERSEQRRERREGRREEARERVEERRFR